MNLSRRTLQFVLVALGLGLASTGARAQHVGDIFTGIENGRIVTGAILPGSTIDTTERVFAATFGDSGCTPFTANPGFDTIPPMFETGTQLGWNAVEPLHVWNGSTVEPIEPTDDEFIEFSFGSQSFSVGTAPVPGFPLFVQSNGGFHIHLNYCMNGCPDVCKPPANATPGVYAVALEIYSTEDGVEKSESFWLVFNYQSSASDQTDAAAWIEANLLDPEPPCSADLVGDGEGPDGVVDTFDLLELLSNWGSSGLGADLDEPNDVVDTFDLLELLSLWGDCPSS